MSDDQNLVKVEFAIPSAEYYEETIRKMTTWWNEVWKNIGIGHEAFPVPFIESQPVALSFEISACILTSKALLGGCLTERESKIRLAPRIAVKFGMGNAHLPKAGITLSARKTLGNIRDGALEFDVKLSLPELENAAFTDRMREFLVDIETHGLQIEKTSPMFLAKVIGYGIIATAELHGKGEQPQG